MRMLVATLSGVGLLMLIDAPPANALSGYCAKRCMPAQRACMRRTGDLGVCNRLHRRCAYRCMGIG